MNKSSLLQPMYPLALVVVLFLTACAPQKTVDEAADTAAINDIWTEYSASLNAGDLERWLSLWTEDGVQMPPGEPPVVGKDHIRTRNKRVLDQFTFDLSVNNEEVGVAGDLAFARGTYTATLTPEQGGEAVVIDGKYMTILARQTDGSWKIRRDIFNSNVPAGE